MNNHTTSPTSATTARIVNGATVTYTARDGRTYEAVVRDASGLWAALVYVPATGQLLSASYARLEA